MPIQSYRQLVAWQLGMELVISTYEVTKSFPREELYGLTSQLRRAAVAIPSNVSEGHQQGPTAYRYYVVKALGSLAEVETQLELSERLQFASATELGKARTLVINLRQVLHGLKRSIKKRQIARPPSAP